jgi:uncharacterized protein (TIGR03089 family)
MRSKVALRCYGPPVPQTQNAGACLTDWLSHQATAPLITHYDRDGNRVELSGATATNAVHKATNLFRDEMLFAPGGMVWIDLPCHWQMPVLVLASWAAGLAVAVGTEPPDDAVATLATGSRDVAVGVRLAVSLDPFGRPLDADLPVGWEDLAALVRGQPDRADVAWPTDSQPWLLAAERPWSGAALLDQAEALATRWGVPRGAAILSGMGSATRAGVLAGTLVPAVRRSRAVLADVADTTSVRRQEGNPFEARPV